MQRVSRQRKHPSATQGWERVIRTDVAIYPKTDHNGQAVHRPGRAPLNPLTFDAVECAGRAPFPSQTPVLLLVNAGSELGYR